MQSSCVHCRKRTERNRQANHFSAAAEFANILVKNEEIHRFSHFNALAKHSTYTEIVEITKSLIKSEAENFTKRLPIRCELKTLVHTRRFILEPLLPALPIYFRRVGLTQLNVSF